MGVSNNITAVLNFIAFLCSIPIIAAGIWLASKPDNECVHAFRWPVVILGVLILLVSLAGFVGAYWNKQGLLAFYLFCMALLIALLLILLVFAFVVTRRDGSYDVPGRNYKEYRLDGFSDWLRDRVTTSANWAKIRTCLADSDVCTKFNQDYITVNQFLAAHISPLQASMIVEVITTQPLLLLWEKTSSSTWSKFRRKYLGIIMSLPSSPPKANAMSGCCKPPTACGFNYVNPTLWINPVNQMADPDCYLWSNDQSQLCYNCNSCKAGLLGNLRTEWRRANVILIVAVVVLIWVYLIACSAFKNAQTEDLFRRYKQGWV
ncbi:Tetraspanin [Parasponia andersonii]|uniref:Tetraspanin n=1 Tax=Parasponia andersonii TaxID=3476 RepID=A0A2P5BNX8_PARAD|nr:Tetraspanin [Parasponia andersonii]